MAVCRLLLRTFYSSSTIKHTSERDRSGKVNVSYHLKEAGNRK